jgi:hypothetical protein
MKNLKIASDKDIYQAYHRLDHLVNILSVTKHKKVTAFKKMLKQLKVEYDRRKIIFSLSWDFEKEIS